MNASYYWGHPNARGHAAALACNLASPVPLMRLHPNEGGNQYLFTSDGKFYLLDLISWEVTIIVSPTGQEAVLKALGQIFTPAGAKELKVEPVPATADSD
jgi:hypothetical protein